MNQADDAHYRYHFDPEYHALVHLVGACLFDAVRPLGGNTPGAAHSTRTRVSVERHDERT